MKKREDRGRIAIAYSGVHQAFQIALAAQEVGELDRFYCSIFDAPGKWGGIVSRITGSTAAANRRCGGIDPARVSENPWPWLGHRIRAKAGSRTANDWFQANEAFDRWAAKRIRQRPAQIVIGVETCARYCFAAACAAGALRVLDLPSFHPSFVENALEAARADTGVNTPMSLDSPEMAERKQEELKAADWLLVYSDMHRQSYETAGYGAKSFFQCPLWVDTGFWHCERDHQSDAHRALKVLFVGAITLQKGIPYLLRAIALCSRKPELTLVGQIHPSMTPFLETHGSNFNHVPPVTKEHLRRIYAEHDILVLPSLADSFGFVAMEAMACRLPVIVSNSCGAPVPDNSWRVPILDSGAIARRIDSYDADRDALKRDRESAVQFARQFTPERYRSEMKRLFTRLLAPRDGGTQCRVPEVAATVN